MAEEPRMASSPGSARTLHLFEENPPSNNVIGSPVDPADRNDPELEVTPRFDVHLLALALIRGVGVHALRALIRSYGNLERIWGEDPAKIAAILGSARVPGSDQIATSIAIEGRQLVAKG